MKRKITVAALLVALVLTTAGVTALAVGTYGSRTDPLVTLSYINETVIPALTEQFEATVEEKAAALSQEFQSRLAEKGGSSAGEEEHFRVVTLSRGQTLRCAVGTELMLRVGTATAAGPDAPRLVDETTGEDISAAGTELVKNHMYLVTIVDNGLSATAATTKVLVRGTYTVA